MHVIGVVDLLDGRAVHARAGKRDQYAPIGAVAGSRIDPGDAIALARAYVEQLGVTELYVADLDAIGGREPQTAAGAAITALGVPVWLDAAVSSVARARQAVAAGAEHVVIGLETMTSYEALAEICSALGGDRVAFSLDLRDGEPITAPDARHATPPRTSRAAGTPAGATAAPLDFARLDFAQGRPCPYEMAGRAADAGVGSVIVLDLARVGTGVGPDLDLIARVRDTIPGLTLLAGGGVRGLDDLIRLADAGCDGALVATALHDGRLTAADVVAARQLGHTSSTR